MGLVAEAIKEDLAVQKWLSNYGTRSSKDAHRSVLNGWINWLWKNGYPDVTPSGLLQMQKQASKDDQYRMLDLLQDFIRQRGGTYNYCSNSYSWIRSFFTKNRVPLPEDNFNIPHTKDPVRPKLTKEHLLLFIQRSDYGRAAFYLTLWQGLMDQERFQYFNRNCGFMLSEHLKSKGIDEPFLIEYPGRKQMRGKLYFYTFIGKDALSTWKKYFDMERGYPSRGESILLNRSKLPIGKPALAIYHLRLLERLGLIKRRMGLYPRYGFNLHEFRDLAKTILHLEGRKEDLDLDAVDFWMGHLPDRNQYDKFYNDRGYMLEQYRIAEKHLNLISGNQEQRLDNIDDVINNIISSKPAFEKLLDALETRLISKLAPTQKALESLEKNLRSSNKKNLGRFLLINP